MGRGSRRRIGCGGARWTAAWHGCGWCCAARSGARSTSHPHPRPRLTPVLTRTPNRNRNPNPNPNPTLNLITGPNPTLTHSRRETHACLARALGCWHVSLCLDSVAQLETLGRLVE